MKKGFEELMTSAAMQAYTGAEFKDLKPAETGPSGAAKAGLFCFFVMTRAIHPTIIDASKAVDPETGKKGLLYGNMTVVLGECIFTLVAGQLIALAMGGMKEWRMCFEPNGLKVFISFTVKCWSTMAILSMLDSVLKNVGEATAVLVIYFMNVSLPMFPDKFEVPSFLAVSVVILSVTAYVGCKSFVDDANKYRASIRK